MHYPGYKRDRFLEWVNESMPLMATIEVDYEEQYVPAEQMLRSMLRCSDIVPHDEATYLEDQLGLERYEKPRTYGTFARLLLEQEPALPA